MSASLGSLINQQAPPPNPATPAQRTNPEHEWYVALQCIRRTIEDAQDHASERGPETQATLDAMRSACSRLLAGVEPKVVALGMAAMATQMIAPQQAAQLNQLAAQMSAPTIAPVGAVSPMPGTPGAGTSPLGLPSMGGGAGGGAPSPTPGQPGPTPPPQAAG